jgi:hypothetical protein
LHWVDETGRVHVEEMAIAGEEPRLFVVPSLVPHAVVNVSLHDVTVLGYADGPLENVESVEVATVAPKDRGGLSAEETFQVVGLLSKLHPGSLPFDIFHEVTRLVATPIIEVVPLRRSADGEIEILLLKREEDDPVWPGQLHIPGTVVRASDAPGSFDEPLRRVISTELAGTKTSEPTFVKNLFHHSGRGMEASQIFWVEIRDKPAIGEFYNANNLPGSVVQSQLDFIPDAVTHFKERRH